ncbi:MAG: dephospho-CoA kinase [Pseudoflavonifractor sp.]|nr:dephospho-CoA kinase [Pseudoflavonifractor sp.]
MARHVTAITGGIGSGKSVVANMLTIMGYDVYDCDTRAKSLMDNSEVIRRRIADEISREAVAGGVIIRKRLSDIVFNDTAALRRLNAIVHSAVREDLTAWLNSADGEMWVETAILYESGLHRLVDDVWEVIAPMELRIRRVMRRNNMEYDDVLARINSQGFLPQERITTYEVINDDCVPLLPQINSLLRERQGALRSK